MDCLLAGKLEDGVCQGDDVLASDIATMAAPLCLRPPERLLTPRGGGSDPGASNSTPMECEVQTAFGVASPVKTFCSGSSLVGLVRVHVVITNATAGTVQLQASNGSGSGTVAIKANSDLVARRMG